MMRDLASTTFAMGGAFVIKIFTAPGGLVTVSLMNSSNLQARRATVDDLVELRKMWRAAGFPAEDLEKRLKEFQIVETPEGTLLGGIGLQLEGDQGKLHSEVCAQPEWQSEVRLRLWERAQAVARNYGLSRLWTDDSEPFWKSQDFEPATTEVLDKLPASLCDRDRPWFVLKLREERPAAVSAEREFELFTQAQRESSERLMRQAQSFKMVAYLILIAVVLLGMVLVTVALLPGATRAQLFKSRSTPSPAQKSSQSDSNRDSPAKREPAPPGRPR